MSFFRNSTINSTNKQPQCNDRNGSLQSQLQRYRCRRNPDYDARPENYQNISLVEKDVDRFYKLFTSNSEIISLSSFDVNDFYNWFDSLSGIYRELTTRYTTNGNRYRVQFGRRGTTTSQLVIIEGSGKNKKEQLYSIICLLIGSIQSQMMNDESGLDGAANQDSVKATTTVITMDAGTDEVGINLAPQDVLKNLSTTESLHSMDSLTNRFQILKTGTITPNSDMFVSLVFPRDLFSITTGTESANLLLFRNFIYSELELEIRIIVNAPKFGQGKLIASWFPDNHDLVDEWYNDVRNMLQRPHCIIDMNLKNQGVLRIPQQYRRTFLRNYQHESSNAGSPYAQMCSLQIGMLSKYKTGTSQPTDVPYVIEYRFLKLNLAGLSFGVTPQMDKIASGVVELGGEFFPPIKIAEKYLKRVGFIGDQDKPFLNDNNIITPTPRRNFSSGVGVSDSIPLVFDRDSTITLMPDYLNNSDPKSLYDICKIPGLRGMFTWTTKQKTDAILWSNPVEPTWHDVNLKTYESVPTPLDFISSGYAFWRGTLKYQFHFVSTPFHTGTVQIQISFNRIGDGNYENTNVYTKLFDLGEQREVDITVPFIYDTPWRRNRNIQLPMYNTTEKSGGIFTEALPYPLSTNFINNTRINVTIVNPLTPLMNVSSEIDVLVFISAGDDFELRSVVPNFFTYPTNLIDSTINFTGFKKRFMTQLPIYYDNAIPEAIDTGTTVPRLQTQLSDHQKFKSLSLLDHKDQVVVTSQNETTDDYTAGINFKHFHSTDNDVNMKTLMRRFYSIGPISVDSRVKTKVATAIDGDGKQIICNGYSAFWLPVCLPTHLNNTQSMSHPVASPLATLGTLFRHWRGSMRYTFVQNKPVSKPVYFSYVPNTGVIYYGNKFQPSFVDDYRGIKGSMTMNDWDGQFSSLGFATEMMLPTVNTSISITVPFDCMFNRCVNTTRIKKMSDDSNFQRIFAREESTMYSGHIVITCDSSVDFDVFQAVGDDFHMQNFVGTVQYSQTPILGFPDNYYFYTKSNVHQTNHHKYTTALQAAHIHRFNKDKKPHKAVEGNLKKIMDSKGTFKYLDDRLKHLDFGSEHLCGSSINGVTSQGPIKQFKSAMNNLSSINTNGLDQFLNEMKTVGDGIKENTDTMTAEFSKMGANFNTFGSQLTTNGDTIASNIEKISANSEKLTKEFGENSKQLMSLVTPILTKLNKILPESKRDLFGSLTMDFIFDIILLIRNFDYTNFSIIILRYLAKFFNVGFDKIMGWCNELTSLIKEKFASRVTQQQSTQEATGSLFGFFVALISSLCKFSFMKDKTFYDYGSKVGDFIFDTRNVSYINQIITLVERVVKAFAAAIRYCQKRKPLETSMKEYFQENNTEILTFMENVDELTNPANKRVLNRADMKARCFSTYLTALKMKQKLAMCSGNSSAVQLMKYVSKIINFVEEQWSRFSCCPVRIEPRVYCFDGPPGCGKSFYSEYFGAELMSAIGYKHMGGNPVFNRINGRKHWDGYADQPIILFDDWMNLSAPENVVEQISDLYQLKSTCEFIPPKASIDEKGARANPRMVILCTNGAFPDNALNGTALHKDAIYRRRDKMIYVRRNEKYVDKTLSTMSAEESKSFAHMEFAFGDPLKPLTTSEFKQLKWINQSEFIQLMRDDFVEHTKTEEEFARRKLARFCADLPPAIRDMADPIANYNYRTNVVMNEFCDPDEMIPSRKLMKEMEEVINAMKDVFDRGDLPSKPGETPEDEPQVEVQGFRDFLKKREGNDDEGEIKKLMCPLQSYCENQLKDDGFLSQHIRLSRDVERILSIHYLGKFSKVQSETKQIESYKSTLLSQMRERLQIDCSIDEMFKLCFGCSYFHQSVAVEEHNKKFPKNKICLAEPDECAINMRWTSGFSDEFVQDHFDKFVVDVLVQNYNGHITKQYVSCFGNKFQSLNSLFLSELQHFPDVLLSLKYYHGRELALPTVFESGPVVEHDVIEYVRMNSIRLFKNPQDNWDNTNFTLVNAISDVCAKERKVAGTNTFLIYDMAILGVEFDYQKIWITYDFDKMNDVAFVDRQARRHKIRMGRGTTNTIVFNNKHGVLDSTTYNSYADDCVDDLAIFCGEGTKRGEDLPFLVEHHKKRGDFDLTNAIYSGRDHLYDTEILHKRRDLAKKIILRAAESEEVAESVHLNSVRIWNGQNFVDLAQEALTTRNPLIEKRIVECHHCQEKHLLQFGNRKHHICITCKETESACSYCDDFTTHNYIYLRPLWVAIKKIGVVGAGKAVVAFLNRLWLAIPKYVKNMIEMALLFCGIGFGYLIGVLGGFGLLGKMISQGPVNISTFNSENFDKMIAQRENYEEQEQCKHHLLQNIDGFDYNDYFWRNVDNDYVIPVYPCKKNCQLFTGDLMKKYKLFCEMFENRQRVLIVNCKDKVKESLSPNYVGMYYSQVPPFCRPTGVPFPTEVDKFVLEDRKKYRQWINRMMNGTMNCAQINPTASILKILGGCLAAIVAAVAAIRGVMGIFRYVSGKFSTPSEQAASYEINSRPFYKARAGTKTSAKVAPVTTQADNQFFIALYKKLFKNFMQFKIYDGDGKHKSDWLAFGVKFRWVLLPKHYYHMMRDMPNNYTIKLKRPYYPEITVDYKFDPIDFQVAEEADLAIFNAPRFLNDFVNITSYMAMEIDFKGVLPGECIIVRGPTKEMTQPMCFTVKMKSSLERRVKLQDSTISELQGVLVYNYSEAGACGSIIMRKDSQRPIIGMHVAGTVKTALKCEGYATLLIQEMLLDVQFEPSLIKENKIDELEDNVGEKATIMFPDMVEVQSLSVLPKRVHLPSKSKIKPSLLHDYDGEPETGIAFLSGKDPNYPHDISPLLAGCSKHGILTKNFKTSDVQLVTKALYTSKYEFTPPLIVNPKKLTIGEAIRGFAIDGYEPMKLKTSAGYPYVFEVKKQKCDYITVTDENNINDRKVFIDKDLLKHIQDMDMLRLDGIIPCLPYVDELKDERKKLAKLFVLGSTRVFCMSPISTTIATRRNFLHFAAMYKLNRIDLQHAVGISRDGPEWGRMANALLANGTKIVTLDYSNFGPGYNAGVCAAAHDIITWWTKKYVSGVSDAEMEVLGEEHYNSLHLMSDLVYRQLSGGPSGDALTVIKNGLVNEIYIMLAWLHLARKQSILNIFETFFTNVKLITYGDDAIMSVSDEVCEWFNGETITAFFKDYGIVATDAEKSGQVVKWKSLLESSFLRSGFVPHPKHYGQWLAPLGESTIRETPRWVFENPNMEEATRENCDQALRLAYGHGPLFFNQFREKLNCALGNLGIPTLLLTWDELDVNFFPEFNL